MNRFVVWIQAFALSAASLLSLSSCTRKTFEAPGFSEETELVKIKKEDFTETAPAYGIYSRGRFEVNIESEDSPRIQIGQAATVQPIPGAVTFQGRLTEVYRNVTAETHQGIAWIEPANPEKARTTLREGDFVFATIILRVKHDVLAIPRSGVFIKESKTWAILKKKDEAGKTEFEPVEIQLGTSSMGEAEVLQGLHEGDTVATGGGIGFLYPDFKAASED